MKVKAPTAAGSAAPPPPVAENTQPPAPVAQAAPPPPPPPPPPAPKPEPKPEVLKVEAQPMPAPQPTAVIPAPAKSQGMVLAPDDLPAYLAADVHTGDEVTPGFENVGASGLQLPMLIIAQPLTPTVVAGKIKAGDIIRQSDKEKVEVPVGKAFSFSIVYHYKEWLEWADRNSGLGILNRSKNPLGDLAKRSARAMAMRGGPKEERQIGDKKVKVDVFEYHVFFVVGEGDKEIMAIPLSRTGYKKGNALINMARKRIGCPIWMGKYEARTVLEQKNNFSWFNWEFKTDGWASQEEKDFLKGAYENCKAMYENVVLDMAADESSALPAEASVEEKGF